MSKELLTPEKFLNDQAGINKYLTWPWALLLASLALGLLSMIIIESVKSAKRYRFLQHELAHWLNGPGYGYFPHSQFSNIPLRWWYLLKWSVIGRKAPEMSANMHYLVLVSTAGNARALFSLPVENLCGQVALGVQTLLDARDAPEDLIYALIGTGAKLPGVKDQFKNFIALRSDKKLPENLMDDYLESKSILAGMIQRNIDSFQILATYRWKRYQRDFAFLVSLIIASLGSMLFAAGRHLISSVFVVLFLSYFGAFFAILMGEVLELVRRRTDAI